MTRGIRIAVLAVICSLLVGVSVGCGAETGFSTDAGSNADTDVNAELARLRELLRGIQELPDGFSARPRDGWSSPFRPVDKDCRIVLDAAGNSPPQRVMGTRVTVTYPGDQLGELAGVGLASYNGDDAELHFAELTEALWGCPVAANSRTRKGTSFTVFPLNLSLDEIGGDVQARRLSGRLNGYPYEMHLVFARIGRTMVSLVHTGIADVDVKRTRQLVRFVVGRAAV